MTDLRTNLSDPLHDFAKVHLNARSVKNNTRILHTLRVVSVQRVRQVGTVDQCLGRDASHIQTIATEQMGFDQRHPDPPDPRTSGRRNQSRRAPTNDHHIIIVIPTVATVFRTSFSTCRWILPIKGMYIVQ